MNGQQQKEQSSGARDPEIRAALDQHWAASDASDFEREHLIYHEDAVLDYPQSGERTRGRRNIQDQRGSQPSKKRFAVRRKCWTELAALEEQPVLVSMQILLVPEP